MTSIRYEGVTLKLGKKVALDNIDLFLESDEIIGLIGDRDAGKNYLLPMLPSFRYPSSGKLMVDGEDAYENSSVMTKVVYTWPTERLHNSRKVMDGFKFCSKLRPKWDMEYALELSKKFELETTARIRKLTPELLAVFNTICGLAARGPITVFDGTFMRLNAERRNLFYAEIREDHKKHPRMIILSTYDATEIQSFIDDAVILDRGQIIAHDTVNRITKSAQNIMGLQLQPSLQEVFRYVVEEGDAEDGQ